MLEEQLSFERSRGAIEGCIFDEKHFGATRALPYSAERAFFGLFKKC
jgi:hypothetical protein